jgi:hypothetical protein
MRLRFPAAILVDWMPRAASGKTVTISFGASLNFLRARIYDNLGIVGDDDRFDASSAL